MLGIVTLKAEKCLVAVIPEHPFYEPARLFYNFCTYFEPASHL